ncbi:MAG: NUDIX hydrolase [Thaumarchaeota archaeon]|nr:NUDIX hydrolase [Nitrososphaerota archaeon]
MTGAAGDWEEKVLSSELLYRGRAVAIRKVAIEMPTGRRGTRVIVEHPGSVAVVPLLDDGRLVLIRQFRLAAGGVIWEIPAGHIERGEEPEACARRELEEETGYRAGKVESLFEAYLSPGSSTELMRFFLATGLEKREQRTEEDEMISVEPLEVEKVVRMIASNEIRDAKSIAAVAYLQAMGRLQKPPSRRRENRLR